MNYLAPSRAAEFFNGVRNSKDPAAYIGGLINQPSTTEREFLDFKGASKLLDLNDENFHRIWSKALSCFANSGGGILIWGIDAPSGAPTGQSLVIDVDHFRAKLLELQARVTEPPVQNVQIEVIPVSGRSGYVLCYIPDSPWKPHRAVKEKGQPYFVRTADRCTPASHSLLQALFQPRLISLIEVFAEAQQIDGQARLIIWLHNAGPATAKELSVRFEWPFQSMIPTPNDELWKMVSSARKGFMYACRRPVHPTEMLNLISPYIGNWDAMGGLQQKIDPFEMSFEFYCLDQAVQRLRFSAASRDILRGRRFRAEAF